MRFPARRSVQTPAGVFALDKNAMVRSADYRMGTVDTCARQTCATSCLGVLWLLERLAANRPVDWHETHPTRDESSQRFGTVTSAAEWRRHQCAESIALRREARRGPTEYRARRLWRMPRPFAQRPRHDLGQCSGCHHNQTT